MFFDLARIKHPTDRSCMASLIHSLHKTTGNNILFTLLDPVSYMYDKKFNRSTEHLTELSPKYLFYFIKL